MCRRYIEYLWILVNVLFSVGFSSLFSLLVLVWVTFAIRIIRWRAWSNWVQTPKQIQSTMPKGPEQGSKSRFNSPKSEAKGDCSIARLSKSVYSQDSSDWFSGTWIELSGLSGGKHAPLTTLWVSFIKAEAALSFRAEKLGIIFSVSNSLSLPLTHHQVPSFYLSLLNVSWMHLFLSVSIATSFLRAPGISALNLFNNLHILFLAPCSCAETWLPDLSS